MLCGRGGKKTTSPAGVKGSFAPVSSGVSEKYESTAALSLRYTQNLEEEKRGYPFDALPRFCRLFPLRCLVRHH